MNSACVRMFLVHESRGARHSLPSLVSQRGSVDIPPGLLQPVAGAKQNGLVPKPRPREIPDTL
jgi:hypothetical protein